MAEHDDIAVVGMSCRVAGASSPAELWDNLISSKDVRSRIDRFTGFYHPDGGRRKGLTNVQHAYTIYEGVEAFDNAFFSVSPGEAAAMDVQQRLLLELTYEAFENAGIPLESIRGSDAAVFVGAHGTSDYAASLFRDLDATAKYTSTGTSAAILANRISYFFDMHGASAIVDTACSSTIVALHQAIATIKSGDSEMAVVAGANVILDSSMFVHMSELGFLSPSGRCRSFDAGGDGYARGEGVVAIVVKRLRDAIRDGDHVRAVIKATRINQDGRTQGLTLPSQEAQRANLESIYEKSGIDPSEIQYVEAHGTGTAVGDPLELSAINAVFNKKRSQGALVVGSVKSNLGHLEACAALVGLVKTILALEHSKIPPQMHIDQLNPKIDWSCTRVPLDVTEWPTARSDTRLAAINSFGFGGTNGHAILESFANQPPASSLNRPFLFMTSAASTRSLREVDVRLADYVEAQQPNLLSLAHTLLSRRSILKHPRFIVASTHADLIAKLRDLEQGSHSRAEEKAANLMLIFTGQGAQWPEMGLQLLRHSPQFRSTVAELDAHLRELGDPPNWLIVDELSKPKETSQVQLSSFGQPLCSAVQIGIVDVLRAWGVQPQTVLGHSSGEVAAAYAAGILTRRDAIVVAYYRGRFLGSDQAFTDTHPEGAMCAVGLSESDSKELLAPFSGAAALAAVNSPSSCTLSGDYDAIQHIIQRCKDDGTFCRALRVDMAYHSHHMLPKSGRYLQAMEDAGVCPLLPPEGGPRMFSSVCGRLIEAGECTPEYWKANMVNTVKFHHALVAAATELPPHIIVEVGPHPALMGPAGDTLASMGLNDIPYSGTISRGKSDLESLLLTAAFLVTNRYTFDLGEVNVAEGLDQVKVYGSLLTDLPRYPWDHTQDFNAESRLSRNARRREFRRHELLGARIPSDNELRMIWRNLLMTVEATWLNDLVARDHTYLPESIYIQMVSEAARQTCSLLKFEVGSLEIRNMVFGDSIPLSLFTTSRTAIETMFTLFRTDDRLYTFSVVFCVNTEEDKWLEGCSGELALLDGIMNVCTTLGPVKHDTQALQYYEVFGSNVRESLAPYHIGWKAISGEVTNAEDDTECYSIDPVCFAEIIRLPRYLLRAQNSTLYTDFKLERISTIRLTPESWKFCRGQFRLDALQCNTVCGCTELSFSEPGEAKGLHLGGMQWERLPKLNYRPPLRSLFFSDCLEPDITLLSQLHDVTLARLIKLACHKWPMADVVLSNGVEQLHDLLLPYFRGACDHQRPRFRSIALIRESAPTAPWASRISCATSTKDIAPQSIHLAFGHISELPELVRVARTRSIVCTTSEDEAGTDNADDSIDLLGKCEDPAGTSWQIWRKVDPSVAQPQPETLALAMSEIGPLFQARDKINVVRLDLSQSLDRLDVSSTVAVLDIGRKSILLEWDGSMLLAWLQPVLEKATHLLWVSKDTEHYVAQPFIKTIRAELPELKASALLLQKPPEGQVGEIISQRVKALTLGLSETEEYLVNNELSIKRYWPDDILSASVGKLPVTHSHRHVGNQEYKLVLSEPKRSCFMVMRSPTDVRQEGVTIRVTHSLVDINDLVAFGMDRLDGSLGTLCAGWVAETSSTKLTKHIRVLAWTTDAHASVAQANENQVYQLNKDDQFGDALVKYYFVVLSLSILTQLRAGADDEFSFTPSQTPLRSFLQAAQQAMQSEMAPLPFGKQSFEITICQQRGVCVGGVPLEISTPTSSLAKRILTTIMSDSNISVPSVRHWPVADALQALPSAADSFSVAILDHSRSSQIVGYNLHYEANRYIFKPNRAYVIVGFGGLASYLALWMAKRGAKHIYALSRRGIQASGAPEAVKTLRSIGCELQILATDASSAIGVSEAFEKIRVDHPIGGIYNMVMVLNDAPILTMTPQQWDSTISTKVQSTWNIHKASLQDELEFFIMFSSIASISGNRMQSNYAIGNAFQNAFAEHRHALGLTAIAVALGTVTGIGVLANDAELLRILSQTGFYPLDAHDLETILEAAINESRFRDRSLLTTGFNMYRVLDGHIQAKPEENQLYWTESPEFGFMLEHELSGLHGAKKVSLADQIAAAGDGAHELLVEAILASLGSVLGYQRDQLDPKSPVSAYGFDSLHAVSVRYWFFNMLNISVPVFDILGCKSINDLATRSLQKLEHSHESGTPAMPEPRHNSDLIRRPLSHSQQRLFFLHRFIPDKTVYNLLLVCKAYGKDIGLEIDRFRTAWSMFLQRHQVLYSKIVAVEDEFQQIPRQDAFFPITYVEVSDSEFEDNAASILATARNFHFRPEAGELVHGFLLQSPLRAYFYIASHHLAWDRTSVSVVFRETAAIYQALGANEDPHLALEPNPIQFIDYTLWQEECLAHPEHLNPQVEYWRKQLEGAPEAASLLPLARVDTRPALKEYKGESVAFELDPIITTRLKDFCKVHAATPFMLLTSALSALFHRLTGDEDVVIGIFDGDRGHSAFDNLIGFTVNILPIRTTPVSNISFSALMEECRTACLEAYQYRSVPFDYLIQALQVPRCTAHSPVTQITVNYQTEGDFPEVDYGDFRFAKFDHYNARLQTDFGFDIEETSEGTMHFTLEYDPQLYTQVGMRTFAQHYQKTVRSILDSHGGIELGHLPVDSDHDRDVIKTALRPRARMDQSLEELDCNLFNDVFRYAVDAFPSKVALSDNVREISYAELDSRTTAIANALINSGVKVGDAVAVYSEQSTTLLLGIYGIIRAGAAYVPIDSDYPEARIESMISDAEISHVLVDHLSKRLERVLACGIEVDCVFEIDEISLEISFSLVLDRIVRPSDPLCIIFTSGSTGKPKGVPLTQQMLRYQQAEYNRILANTAEDRIALGVSMVFDLSLCAIYGSILVGATTIIATREDRLDPARMVNLLVDGKITSVIFSPTQLKALFTAPNRSKLERWKDLRNLTACGEALPPWIVREFHRLNLPNAQFYNAYAPAETTVVNSMALMQPIDGEGADCFIANPMSTNQFYILDKHRYPVPLGTAGELYIGGCTIAEGYLNRPDLTAEVFHTNPWPSEEDVKHGFTRMYQTGDLFKISSDGRLHCLGRISGDRQVKIRGMRTELGEIESAIFDASQQLGTGSGPRVSLVAVVYPKDEFGEGTLIAYICLNERNEDHSGEQPGFEHYLKTTLRETLPSHMIPSRFIFVPDMPKTGSNKTDYKALLARPILESTIDVNGDEHARPLTKLQMTIAETWNESLGMAKRFAPSDNFFASGGHSMLLIKVANGLKQRLNVDLQLTDLFERPTIAGMESLCHEATGMPPELLEDTRVDGSTPNEQNGVLETHAGVYTNGHAKNGHLLPKDIDWTQEASLDGPSNWLIEQSVFEKPRAIAMTGALTMIGVHFLQHVLHTTEVQVFCLAIDVETNPKKTLIDALRHGHSLPETALARVVAWAGSLSAPNLGLDADQARIIDTEVQAIYHLDSEVSLLKDYSSIRAGNIGAAQAIIKLAAASKSPKPVHYLSTWGVPHLQAWYGTKRSSKDWVTSEVEMSSMIPASTPELGYLKCRWACEALFSAAGRRGLPVTIIRTTMCAPAPGIGASVAQSDINRRILAASLIVGAVPDFASHQGGGMSWMTADILVQGIWHLTHKKMVNSTAAAFCHIISEQHILYRDLASLVSTPERPIASVTPQEWFQRLRAQENIDMDMHAAVLEKWWQAGWVPFQIDSAGTMQLLRDVGIEAHHIDRNMLMDLVVGEHAF